MLSCFYSLQKHRRQREKERKSKTHGGIISSAILEHLKIIDVRCDAVNERIFKLALFPCVFHRGANG